MILLALLAAATGAGAAPAPTVSAIAPIALHDGINTVPGFMPDGAAATIVQAWRANGNAHSYHDWLVLAPAAEEHASAVVTHVDPATDLPHDLIQDAPFDGERVLADVRFARGLVDGKPASLLLDATLDQAPSGIAADHATATVRIYRLEATDGDAGDSPYEFRPIVTIRSTSRYCNAELALSQVLRIPIGADYGGINDTDGCFTR